MLLVLLRVGYLLVLRVGYLLVGTLYSVLGDILHTILLGLAFDWILILSSLGGCILYVILDYLLWLFHILLQLLLLYILLHHL